MANTKVPRWDVLRAIFPRFQASRRSVSLYKGPTSLPRLADLTAPVTSETALKNTALYAGIRLLSENIASLPKAIKRFSAEGWKADEAHPAYRVINIRPNDYTNVFNFWSCIITWVKGWGNAYAFIERDGSGRVQALHQIHPACVKVTTVGPRKYYYVDLDSGDDRSWLNGVHSDADMLHFMELTLDGLQGVNPIIYNACSLGKSAAMEKFAAAFYTKGGNFKAVMETEGSMGEEEYQKFIDHVRAAGDHGTPLLEYGVKYKQLPVDPLASQLVQSEVLGIQDVCRILNVPPHMIAELSHATFSNIEHQTIQFVQYSLRPLIKRIEMELEDKLFFESERGRYDVKFILDGLLRGDTAARSAYYHNAILDGYMSRNEVREIEGLTRKDGLDDYLVPLNYNIVGKENQQ